MGRRWRIFGKGWRRKVGGSTLFCPTLIGGMCLIRSISSSPPKNHFRFRLSTALDVLSDRAIPFKSLAQASRFIDKKFDGDTSANFAMFLEIQAAERREERYIWSEDASLPQGWKLRTAQGRTEKQFFLAPDGQQFSSRRQGYQHLIR